jgi:hypothetical protein
MRLEAHVGRHVVNVVSHCPILTQIGTCRQIAVKIPTILFIRSLLSICHVPCGTTDGQAWRI